MVGKFSKVKSSKQPIYNVNDTVKAADRGVLYDAKILRIQSINNINHTNKYFIHFKKWGRKADIWIDENLIAHEDDIAKQSKMPLIKNGIVQETKTNDNESNNVSVSKDNIPIDNNKSTDIIQNNNIVATIKRKKEILANENDIIRKHRKKMALSDLVEEDDPYFVSKIPIPNLLKKQLVDEWRLITDNKPMRLLQLPKESNCNVESVIKEYLLYKKDKLIDDDTQYMQYQDLFDGLLVHFNKALPAILLYRQERSQYEKLVKDFPDKLMSELYGVEHLLRFYVRLPKLLTNVFLPAQEVNSILAKFADFLKYLNKFVTKYIDNSKYIEVDETQNLGEAIIL